MNELLTIRAEASLAASRKRLVSGVCGTLALASLAVVRVVASATESAVFLAGRQLHWDCPVRMLLGVPCPTCGMMRSVVMTLGGDLWGALALNPGGPLLVCGIILCGVLLLLHALRPAARGDASSLVPAQFRPAFWAAAFGCVWAAVVLIHWVREIG